MEPEVAVAFALGMEEAGTASRVGLVGFTFVFAFILLDFARETRLGDAMAVPLRSSFGMLVRMVRSMVRV